MVWEPHHVNIRASVIGTHCQIAARTLCDATTTELQFTGAR